MDTLKRDKRISMIFNGETFRNNFIFFAAYFLIMCKALEYKVSPNDPS
jgi:hypothetical protein